MRRRERVHSRDRDRGREPRARGSNECCENDQRKREGMKSDSGAREKDCRVSVKTEGGMGNGRRKEEWEGMSDDLGIKVLTCISGWSMEIEM